MSPLKKINKKLKKKRTKISKLKKEELTEKNEYGYMKKFHL